MKKLIVCALFISLTGLVACKKNIVDPDRASAFVDQTNVVAHNGYKPTVTKNIALNLMLKSPDGQDLPGVVVNVDNPDTTKEDAAIFSGMTDKNGNLDAVISVPASLKKVIIDPSYLRILHDGKADINNNTI